MFHFQIWVMIPFEAVQKIATILELEYDYIKKLIVNILKYFGH